MKTYIGIDNGVTGSIGIIQPDGKTILLKAPVKSQLSYTKKKQNITRIRYEEVIKILNPYSNTQTLIIFERPMVNPGRFKATMSAIRSLECYTIAAEMLSIPYMFIDSKEWQRVLLPSGLQNKELKTASMDIGQRLFPEHKSTIQSIKDADALLIAEFARRCNL